MGGNSIQARMIEATGDKLLEESIQKSRRWRFLGVGDV